MVFNKVIPALSEKAMCGKVIITLSFMLVISLILGIADAQVMPNPISYPQSPYQPGQVILQVEYENGSVVEYPVQLNKVYPTVYGNGGRGNMSVTRDQVIIRYQLTPGGPTFFYTYDINPPIDPATGAIVRIRMPSEVDFSLQPSTTIGQSGYITSYPAGVAASQYNITGNLGPSTVAPSLIPAQPVNRGPAPAAQPAPLGFPSIPPEAYFIILFAIIIGWLLLLRLAHINSLIITIGGVEVILFLGTFLGWVSIFIGVCLMILSIVPVLLEYTEILTSHFSKIGGNGGEE